ncbi:MAG: hypothetical protein U9N79_08335 [Actinomycetota bacterium]|nr:hypothetical protein [Actinomycetota bacterium]
MTKRTLLIVAILAAVMTATGAATAVNVDPVARTVSSSTFEVQFSATNPEEVSSLRWNDSVNLTATGATHCGDPLEYFGNSWVAPDSPDFKSLVGWGQTGSWTAAPKAANIDSVSESASGCYGTLDIPIKTTYRFWDNGPVANRIKVARSFDFTTTSLAQDFRPYIPRLYPADRFNNVIYPDVTGTTLMTTASSDCPFGCQVTDWDDSWFAMHDPATDTGLIVRQASSGYDTDLWIDNDGASETNATGVLMLQPAGGFTGKVNTNTFLCFYDNSTWTPSLTLPNGC